MIKRRTLISFYCEVVEVAASSGTDERDWVEECDRLLDVVSPPTAIHGGQLKLTWLHEQFTMPLITYVEAQ